MKIYLVEYFGTDNIGFSKIVTQSKEKAEETYKEIVNIIEERTGITPQTAKLNDDFEVTFVNFLAHDKHIKTIQVNYSVVDVLV